MRIAQISPGSIPIPPNSWGAVEKIIWNYKIYLEKIGHTVDIKYINEIIKNDYDIVHVHMANHAIEMYEREIPYIFTCHDHHTYIHGKNSLVYETNIKAMMNAEVATVPAKYLIDYFENIPICLRHGINEEEFFVGRTNKNLKLLVVGKNGILDDNTFDRKGFRYAIEAAKILKMPITVVGPTNSNKDFFNSNLDLLKDNVNVLYDLNDMELQKIYREHDILIHASSVEAGHPPLTLLEAASSGLPIISTDCCGDLYTLLTDRNTKSVVNCLNIVMNNYDTYKKRTVDSVKKFYWSNVINDLLQIYSSSLKPKNMKNSALKIYNKVRHHVGNNKIFVNFLNGPFVEIRGQYEDNYNIKFIDNDNSNIMYETNIQNNNWAVCNIKRMVDWKIIITSSSGEVFEYRYDLTDKTVLISLESSSLGDTLAWIPYIEEFRKKHNCNVVASTFMNNLFEDVYTNIKFVNPGESVNNVYAMYKIGWFFNNNSIDYNIHKNDIRKIPLQQASSDILGLDYTEIKPQISEIGEYSSNKPYICIAIHSTAQTKYWNNPTGWQELVDYVKSKGYDVYLLSKEEDGYMGNKHPDGVLKINNKSLKEIGAILKGSMGFVGIGSGLSWFSWTLNVPTILISGFSDPIQEMQKDVIRIINKKVCNGCFSKHIFDPGDWNWCPEHKGSERQFECSKSITFDMVKPHLDNFFEKNIKVK